MVLSETTGVAAEARDSAILVEPNDVDGTARAMAFALEMGREEREQRIDQFRSRIYNWTARDWLARQLADLGLTAVTAAGDEDQCDHGPCVRMVEPPLSVSEKRCLAT
jgi:trehalose-6-phosphate synthase